MGLSKSEQHELENLKRKIRPLLGAKVTGVEFQHDVEGAFWPCILLRDRKNTMHRLIPLKDPAWNGPGAISVEHADPIASDKVTLEFSHTWVVKKEDIEKAKAAMPIAIFELGERMISEGIEESPALPEEDIHWSSK